MAADKVIIIEDSKVVRLGCQQTLEAAGFEVNAYSSVREALPEITREFSGIVISDVNMPEMDGLAILRRVRATDPNIPVVLITAQADIPTAVQAIREGAYEFLEKSFTDEVLLEVTRRAMEKRQLMMAIRKLRQEPNGHPDANYRIIGKSAVMTRLRQTIASMSGSDPDVLIYGETGSGKDLVARCLHEQSPRREGNFVSINCGALPENIIESELFGHEMGAFTGADHRRIGKFEYARGGTVFLDEIESMPLHLQVKLLHVIQDRVVYRIGSNEPVPVDVRVIAATKVDLKEASVKNKFRKDLYYRLNVFQLYLAPLRECKEDIPVLFNYFVAQIGQRYKVSVFAMPTREFMQGLLARDWEGNVRELKNEAEKFILQLVMDLPDHDKNLMDAQGAKFISENNLTLNDQLNSFEKTIIEQELIRQRGDIKNTYLALGIPRQTLYYKIQKYGLNRKNYQKPQMSF